jgi:hypothetical protein
MKVCRICQEDCSSKPRVRDAEGNYYCKACLERQKASGAAPAAAAAAAAPASADRGYSLADLMEDNGLEGAQMCPQCGNAMRVGAALCIRCGYDPQKGKSLKTAVTVEKEPKEEKVRRSSGAGVSLLSGLFDESPILPIVSALAHGGLLVAAMQNEDLRLMYFAVAGAIGFGVTIWGVVLMFSESVLHAIVGFLCWFYWIYWVVVHSDNRALQWMAAISILGSVLGRALLGFPEREI